MVTQTSFGHLVLVTGPESLLADRAVEEARAAALREDPAAQVTDVAAATLTHAALADMSGGSLFAERSVAIIRDLAEIPAELVDAVAALAANVPEEVALILQHGGGNKGKGLLDKVKKAKPTIVDCPAIKPWKLPEFVTGEVPRRRGRIDMEAARALVAAVGNDARALAAAVDQLLADTDGEPLDSEVVARYFAGRAEVTAYAVADDVLAGHVSPALEKLRWALETGASPAQLTATLAGSLRTLGKYVSVRDARMSDAQIAAAIGAPPWKIRDLAQQAKTWSEARVAAGLAAVAVADAQVKGGSAVPDFVLEDLVLRLARRP